MKVLLTGVTGFLGSHVAERLAATGHKVRCLVRGAKPSLPPGTVRDGLEIRTVDFGSIEALVEAFDGIERVYHVAGTTRARTTEEYYTGNVTVTTRLADACIRSGAKIDRFVFVSSLSAVGPTQPGQTTDESSPYRPVSHYGRSKMLAELELGKRAEALKLVVVRPAAIYGPRERDLLSYFRMIRKGFYPVIGIKRRFLNFAHCDDVVQGIVLAGNSTCPPGSTYFIAGDRSYDTDELAGAISAAMGVRARSIIVPVAAVWVVGLLSEVWGRVLRTPVFFNLQKVHEAKAISWDCSIEKARKELGYNPAVDFADGMRTTYRWYLDHGLVKI